MGYNPVDFSEQLKAYQQQQGFSYEALADRIGVTKKTINNWMNIGRSRRPDRALILRMAAALGLDRTKTTKLLQLADYPYPSRGELTELIQTEYGYVKEVLWEWVEGTLQKQFLTPPEPDCFVDREEDENLFKLLTQAGPHSPIIGLVGMGGMGKTTLATQVAHEVDRQNVFPDGILWAHFTDKTTPEAVLQKFLAAYDIGSESFDLYKRSSLLHRVLADKKVLIVLDNVEHSGQIEWIIPKGNQNVALITTRNQEVLNELQEKGRQVETHRLKRFKEAEGLQLFATKIKPRGDILAEEAALKETIDLVGGLPLALVIIAAYLTKHKNLTVTHYNKTLAERIRLQRLFHPGNPNINITASFELSYEDLSPLWQKLFVSLSVFDGPDFDLEAIDQIVEAGPIIFEIDMDFLCSHSLVEAGPAERKKLSLVEGNASKRYHLHPLLKDFAREKLEHEDKFKDELAGLQQRKANYFANVAQKNGSTGYRFLDLDWENIMGALQWAYEHQQRETLLQGVQGLTWIDLGVIGFMDARGYWKEARQILAWVLEDGDTVADLLTQASLQTKLGTFAYRQVDVAKATECFRESRKLLNELPVLTKDEVLLQRAQLQGLMAGLPGDDETEAEFQKDREIKLDWLEKSIAELAPLNMAEAQYQRGYLYILQSVLLGDMGVLDQAIDLAQKGVGLLPDRPTSAKVSGLINLSNFHYWQGQAAAAGKYINEGLGLAEALNDLPSRATLYDLRGTTKAQNGKFAEAIADHQQALKLYHYLGSIFYECTVRASLGLSYNRLGEAKQALAHLTAAIELAEKHNLPEAEAAAKINLARSYIDQGRFAEAVPTVRKAYDICRREALVFELPETLSLQAEIALANNDLDAALSLADEALQAAKMGSYWLAEGVSLRIKANVLSQMGHFEQAEAAYQTSQQILFEQDQYELAQTQLAAAGHYARYARTASAIEKATEALALFKKLDAKREIASTEALFAKLDTYDSRTE